MMILIVTCRRLRVSATFPVGLTRFGGVPRLRYFAQAREAAGTAAEDCEATTVGDVLDAAVRRHGPRFESVLAISAVWLDGEPCSRGDLVASDGEVAVLPPVSGGFTG